MHDVTGLILAGGRGERVGGADKGWLQYQGRPLILHVAERLRPQVQALLVSANRNLDRYAELADVVADVSTGTDTEAFAGPLIGVLAGLRRTQTTWLAIVPCDAPHLPLDLVQRLRHAIGAHDSACVRVNGALQPTFALVRSTVGSSLEETIRSGERALHRWLASLRTVAVDFDDEHAFSNINTHADGKRVA